MSWIDSAKKRVKRGARNFTHKPAQARIPETLDQLHGQISNALQVNSHEVVVYKQTKIGRPCSCNKIDRPENPANQMELPKEESETVAPILAPQGSKMDGVEITLMDDDVFGDFGSSQSNVHHGDTPEDSIIEAGDMALHTNEQFDREALADVDEDLKEFYDDSLFTGSNVNCGICYRSGYQPGFEPLGHKYFVLTNYDIGRVQGYHVDNSAFPAQMQIVSPEGYVEFIINIPKYFKSCLYSVRDNEELLKGARLYKQDGSILTKADLDLARGGETILQVRKTNFTHVSICFDLNLNPTLANLSEETNSLNYEISDTSGNITVVMNANIGRIGSGDVIHVPKKRLTLKVTDAPRKQTADHRIIEWNVTTRVLQPNEYMKNIHKGYVLR